MHVNTKADSVTIKVVDRVEVFQESITNEEKILVLTWKSAFVNDEVALFMARLIEVLFWVNLENVVTHLESDWFDLWGDVFAAFLHVTEGLI